MHTGTGQTPFFSTLGREVTVTVHCIYPVPKADKEMELLDWTEKIKERFQTAYASMREKQKATVRRNAQYYKPLMSKFEIREFIIKESFDKLRSCWAGLYKIIRKTFPALVEVMEIFENGKSRLVSIDILKEFRGDNNTHGFPRAPSYSTVLQGDKIE